MGLSPWRGLDGGGWLTKLDGLGFDREPERRIRVDVPIILFHPT